ncbi:hypothetical protein FisN_6Lu450 [Fistulifera solaris]|uniref:Uncharacterized protein n=1 Tax=Fistulifera solaris TaxID=1519565 RepID=A0A1Z5JSZ5_FISSO|nr:hypothetical protein FisN_6Lu450 [Fistulifera solaris]|eukprot:GAX17147.1 hypothetical protein FisN_6Lu450 [Fistulifera solaris]
MKLQQKHSKEAVRRRHLHVKHSSRSKQSVQRLNRDASEDDSTFQGYSTSISLPSSTHSSSTIVLQEEQESQEQYLLISGAFVAIG